jgi:formate-dependent nitrite reductase cytochrome c552 subunit
MPRTTWHGRCLPRSAVIRELAPLAALAGLVTACGSDDVPRTFAAPRGSASAEETIAIPDKLTSIETGEVDALGRPVRIACATCHSLRDEAEVPARAEELTEFHAGLTFEHGSITCASCHVATPREAPRLKLADGTILPMVEAMQLCAQCHGPQFRDYRNGAHGGMTGAWDLGRGGRTRNHCVDCHDPHVPRTPPVHPAAKMRDRIPVGDEGEHP